LFIRKGVVPFLPAMINAVDGTIIDPYAGY